MIGRAGYSLGFAVNFLVLQYGNTNEIDLTLYCEPTKCTQFIRF